MFDPTIGRWLMQDPEGFDAGDPNLYRYVKNDPVNLTDPSGLDPEGLLRAREERERQEAAAARQKRVEEYKARSPENQGAFLYGQLDPDRAFETGVNNTKEAAISLSGNTKVTLTPNDIRPSVMTSLIIPKKESSSDAGDTYVCTCLAPSDREG